MVVYSPRAVGSTVPHLLILSQTCLLKLKLSLLSFCASSSSPSSSFAPLSAENTQSTHYRVSPDSSLRVTFASGMEISLQFRAPHPGRRSTPWENATSLCRGAAPTSRRWRQRKAEQRQRFSFRKEAEVDLGLTAPRQLVYFENRSTSLIRSPISLKLF